MIIGTEEVRIRGDKLTNTGGLIANISNYVEDNEEGGVRIREQGEWEDGGNVVIEVNELENRDLVNTEYRWNESAGITVTLGQNDSGGSDPSRGTTQIQASNGGVEREGVESGTIGQGDVRIGGENVGEADERVGNRDIRNTDEITVDEKTGGLNVDASFDNRLVTDTGDYVNESVRSVVELPGNAVRAGERVGDALGDVKDAGLAGITKGVNPVMDYQKSVEFRQATLEFQRYHPELAEVLNNSEKKGAREYEEALREYTSYVQNQMGNGPVETRVYDSNQMVEEEMIAENGHRKDGMGMTDMERGDVYINIGQTDMSDTKELIGVVGHENIHAAGERSETVADRGMEQAQNAWSRENQYNGATVGGGYSSGQEWYRGNNSSSVVMDGTREAVDAVDVVPLTVFVHGTNASPKTADPEFIKAVGETFNEDVVQFEWSGKLDHDERVIGGRNLTDYVNNYQFKEGEKLNIVGHSHGGNVIKEFTQNYDGEKKVDNVVFMGTPQMKKYRLDFNDMGNNANAINLYDTGDGVQKAGSGRIFGGRKMESVQNIPIYKTETVRSSYKGTTYISEQHIGPYDSHVNLDTAPIWNHNIKPELVNPKTTEQKK